MDKFAIRPPQELDVFVAAVLESGAADEHERAAYTSYMASRMLGTPYLVWRKQHPYHARQIARNLREFKEPVRARPMPENEALQAIKAALNIPGPTRNEIADALEDVGRELERLSDA